MHLDFSRRRLATHSILKTQESMPSSCSLSKCTLGNRPAALYLLASFFFFNTTSAVDTIIPNQLFLDGQMLVSSGGVFQLSFFSLTGSGNRYLGISFHNISEKSIVWVANRDRPLKSSGGALNLTADGNLVLLDQNGVAVWSSNTSLGAANPVVQLLDTGNLVLNNAGDDNSNLVWQSFDLPTDTWLPGMKIGRDLRTNRDHQLTSWKSESDPSSGSFSLRVDPHGAPQIYIWNTTTRVYRNGPLTGEVAGTPLNISVGFIQIILDSNKDGSYYRYETLNSSVLTQLVISSVGQVQRLVWVSNTWLGFWKLPMDDCDIYAKCGAYGFCDPSGSPYCQCLNGFYPQSREVWAFGDGSHGCARRTALSCGNTDGFSKLTRMKLPDTSNATMVGGMNLDGCREMCLKDCSCLAFAMIGDGSSCLTWPDTLTDLRIYSERGQDLYVKLAASELGTPVITYEDSQAKRRPALIIKIAIPLGVIPLGVIVWLFLKQLRKGGSPNQHLVALDNSGKAAKDKLKAYGLLLYPLSEIAKSTNSFSNENKLGQGGFGTVYKGKLPNGTEIAVKRLSRGSEQGIEEFTNEISLIAKLQHKNLVRLLGCCIRGDEKLLVYEYMPNNSLDHFLFDPNKTKVLEWEDRRRIIEGVAQGLVYLHEYSRLKVIHRDLKLSNILLDAEMNPKISDFGIARIFSGNRDQEKTNTVIGTYGYMPPEYAVQGLFSDKSDVFSFGVLVLEILSGQKNGKFIWIDGISNLLRHALECWKADRITELIDPVLRESCPLHELSHCVHVALLCVQESAADRPTMSSVLNLLSGNAVLPAPSRIAFASGSSPMHANSRLDSSPSNGLTITAVGPR